MYLDQWFLTWDSFVLPGHIWPCLETFLVVVTGGGGGAGEMSLAFSG